MEQNQLQQIELEERLGRSLPLDQLEQALCKAQSVMESAEKKTKGFNYKYAKLTDIIDASRPTLTAQGLTIKQRFIKIDQDYVLRTILAHTSGQWISSDYPIRELEDTKKSREQSIGTWISYIRRYAYISIICLNIDDDTDDDGIRSKPAAAPAYITDAQVRLLENKMIGNRDIAERIKVKYGIEDRRKIFAQDFNKILQEFNLPT